MSGPDVDQTTGNRWQQSPAARLRLHRPSKASQPCGIQFLEAYHSHHVKPHRAPGQTTKKQTQKKNVNTKQNKNANNKQYTHLVRKMHREA